MACYFQGPPLDISICCVSDIYLTLVHEIAFWIQYASIHSMISLGILVSTHETYQGHMMLTCLIEYNIQRLNTWIHFAMHFVTMFPTNNSAQHTKDHYINLTDRTHKILTRNNGAPLILTTHGSTTSQRYLTFKYGSRCLSLGVRCV